MLFFFNAKIYVKRIKRNSWRNYRSKNTKCNKKLMFFSITPKTNSTKFLAAFVIFLINLKKLSKKKFSWKQWKHVNRLYLKWAYSIFRLKTILISKKFIKAFIGERRRFLRFWSKLNSKRDLQELSRLGNSSEDFTWSLTRCYQKLRPL